MRTWTLLVGLLGVVGCSHAVEPALSGPPKDGGGVNICIGLIDDAGFGQVPCDDGLPDAAASADVGADVGADTTKEDAGIDSGGLVIDVDETYPPHTPAFTDAGVWTDWGMSRSCPSGSHVVTGDCLVLDGVCDYVLGSEQSPGWMCSSRNDSDAPCTVRLHLVCSY